MKQVVLAAALVLTSNGFAGAEPGPKELVLSCSGAFAQDSDIKRVTSVFGAENVKQEKVDGAEGESIEATVIFGDDAKRRVEILWWDEPNHSRPSTIRLAGDENAWSLGGLHMGSPVKAVNDANGKPYKISGFDWDYGGLVQDWSGGKIPALAGGSCTVQIGFSHDGELPGKLMGDGVTVISTDKSLLKGKVYISSLGLGWAEK